MKKRVLDKVYDEFETQYKDMPEEVMKKEIEILTKEIAGKEASLAKLDGEAKEKMEKDLDKKTKKLNNLEGYTKNKSQISKIKQYKGTLATKLENAINEKNNSKTAFKEAKKKYEEIHKILSDESKTTQMDQNEYNDLQIQKENIEKEIQKQKEIFEKSKMRIQELQSKIGKCDLAWKTLFTNKTWDDIQLRATNSKMRFTGKTNIKDELIEEQEPMSREDQKLEEQIKENVKTLYQSTTGNEENLPAKVTTWSKIKNFFRSISAKLFGQAEPEKGDNGQKKAVSNTKQQKDEFLEALRQNVDVDYRKAVRKSKEQQYIEQHKAKSEQEK